MNRLLILFILILSITCLNGVNYLLFQFPGSRIIDLEDGVIEYEVPSGTDSYIGCLNFATWDKPVNGNFYVRFGGPITTENSYVPSGCSQGNIIQRFHDAISLWNNIFIDIGYSAEIILDTDYIYDFEPNVEYPNFIRISFESNTNVIENHYGMTPSNIVYGRSYLCTAHPPEINPNNNGWVNDDVTTKTNSMDTHVTIIGSDGYPILISQLNSYSVCAFVDNEIRGVANTSNGGLVEYQGYILVNLLVNSDIPERFFWGLYNNNTCEYLKSKQSYLTYPGETMGNNPNPSDLPVITFGSGIYRQSYTGCTGNGKSDTMGADGTMESLIILNGNNNLWAWHDGESPSTVNPFLDITVCVAHEIGHSLGFGHITSWTGISPIMAPTYDWTNEREIQTEDRHQFQLIYDINYGGGYDNDENEISNIETKLSNYPNPFNPYTNIEYKLIGKTESPEIVIFNVKGQKVKTLSIPENSLKGTVEFNGQDTAGNNLGSGIYLCVIKNAGKVVSSTKLILLK